MTQSNAGSPGRSSQRKGIFLILAGALAIGIMPSAAKIAYQEGANPMAAIIYAAWSA